MTHGGNVARPIRSWQDAERTAVDWMRVNGFEDARMTASGSDEGIDVAAGEAVAQVKAHVVKVGRPDVQRLFGVAAADNKQALFFSLGGFTAEAERWASKVGVALFTFNLESEVEAVNRPASRLVAASRDPHLPKRLSSKRSSSPGHLPKRFSSTEPDNDTDVQP